MGIPVKPQACQCCNVYVTLSKVLNITEYSIAYTVTTYIGITKFQIRNYADATISVSHFRSWGSQDY